LTTVSVELRKVSDDDSLAIVNELKSATLVLNNLYGNVSVIAKSYFLDESADDIDGFETPRLGK